MKRKTTIVWVVAVIIILLAILAVIFIDKNQSKNPITENPATPTIASVLGIPAADQSSWKPYQEPSGLFSTNYPSDWIINAHPNDNPTGAQIITEFLVSKKLVIGTNLGSDTSISIEKITSTTGTCKASDFFDSSTQGNNGTPLTNQNVLVGDHTWTMATTSDAGAGNRYQETVFSYPYPQSDSSRCLGVRLFIHYAVLENFTPRTAIAFDADALNAIYESVVNSSEFN